MSLGLINILLWVPFLFVALIAALVYVISGTKRGLGNALVSLGTTLLSVVLSVLLARLISLLISAPVSGLIPFEEMFGDEMPSSLVNTVTEGLVQMLLSQILFFLFFIIITAILRYVGRKIFEKVKNKNTVKPISTPDQSQSAYQSIKKYPAGLRVAGAAVGIVSAFIFSIVLLLPIYGTLAAYVPVAETFVRMSEISESDPAPLLKTNESEIILLSSTGTKKVSPPRSVARVAVQPTATEILECITSHPLVKVSGSAPVAAVYNSVSAVSVNGTSINLPEMADIIDRLGVKINKLTTLSPDDSEFLPLCKEMVDILRKDVINSQWAYDIYCEAAAVMKEEIANNENDDDMGIYADLISLLDISHSEFTATGEALLEFISYSLEKDIISIMAEEDEEKLLSSGILKELGKTLNSTDTIVSLKANYIRIQFTEYFSRYMSEADINDFLRSYPVTRITDPELYEIEAAVIMSGADNILMLLEQLPYFGSEALRDLTGKINFEAALKDKYPNTSPDVMPEN